MTSTQIANLALDLLGEPPLTDLDTDASTTAETVRLHYEHTLAFLLEQHHWAFGTQPATLLPNDDAQAASVTLNPTGSNNDILITAAATGTDGNLLTAEIATSTGHALTVAKSANHILITAGSAHQITITGLSADGIPENTKLIADPDGENWTPDGSAEPPTDAPYITTSETTETEVTFAILIDLFNPLFWLGTGPLGSTPDQIETWTPNIGSPGTPTLTASPPTAAQAIAAGNAALEETFANAPGSDGTGTLAAVASTPFQGGRTTILPDWGTSYDLPADCLRVLSLTGPDRDAPLTQFRILGRKILLPPTYTTSDRLTIEYITSEDTTWPATFREAFIQLLASRIATRITGDPNRAAALKNDHRETLARAQLKDSQETRSNENNIVRSLILRSPLVRSRQRYSGATDYTPEPPVAP